MKNPSQALTPLLPGGIGIERLHGQDIAPH